MGFFDKVLDTLRLNDNYDEDEAFLDEEDLEEGEEDLPKTKNRFFKKMSEEDAAEEDDYVPPRRQARKAPKSQRTASSKVTPMRRKSSGSNMEVCVIRPSSMEETREITDTLLVGCTVVLNLEGIDVEVAQRIIDFSSGACYAIQGSLQKVSSYIFILTPSNVEISGDIQDLLNGTVHSIASDF